MEVLGMLTAGYSSQSQPNIRPQRTNQPHVSTFPDDTFAIPIAISQGASGAPVLRATNALVVGVVVEQNTDKWAVVQPLYKVLEFLETYGGVQLSDQELSMAKDPMKFKEESWSEIFSANRNKQYTNLNLGGMISVMWRQKPWPGFHKSIEGCDIYFVGEGRELGVYGGRLYAMANDQGSVKSTAKYLSTQAKVQDKAGNREKANILNQVVKTLYAKAIWDALESGGKGGYMETMLRGLRYESVPETGLVMDKENPIWGAASGSMPGLDTGVWEGKEIFSVFKLESFDKLLHLVPKSAREKGIWFEKFPGTFLHSDEVAGLFYEYAKAGLEAEFSTASAEARNRDNWEAVVAAVWGTQVASSKKLRGLNMELIGDGLSKLGKMKEAGKSYAEAWKTGLTTHEVLMKFGGSLQEDKDRVQSVKELINKLKSTRGLDGWDMRKVLSSCPTC